MPVRVIYLPLFAQAIKEADPVRVRLFFKGLILSFAGLTSAVVLAITGHARPI